MQTNLAVKTHELTRQFGNLTAVEAVSLEIPQGAVYGFLGQNGSGKTTTLRMILGLLTPSSGTARIFGHDVASERENAARITGALIDARGTYDHLSGHENLRITCRMLGLHECEIDRVALLTDVADYLHRRVSEYSLGMRQRLGLARALLGSPRLLVLDEPMNGLDPAGMHAMRHLIHSLPIRTGVTVLLSSHLLTEVQAVASHVGLMNRGRLVMQGATRDVLNQLPGHMYLRTNDATASRACLAASGLASSFDGAGLLLDYESDEDLSRVSRLMHRAGFDIYELAPRPRTLEALCAAHTNSARE